MLSAGSMGTTPRMGRGPLHRARRAGASTVKLARAWALGARDRRTTRAIVESLLADGALGERTWQIRSVASGAHRVTQIHVAPVPPTGPGPALLASLAPSASTVGVTALTRAETALRLLAERDLPPEVAAVLPAPPVVLGNRGQWTWLVQRSLPGEPADRLAEGGRAADREALLGTTATVISALHQATAEPVDGVSTVPRWVRSRVELIAQLDPVMSQRVDALGERLSRHLEERTLPAGWVHGDLWPANVLVAGDRHAVSGLVDWESAAPGEHPCQDVVHLVLMTRRLATGGSYGDHLRAALADGAAWSPAEASALVMAGIAPGSTAGGDPRYSRAGLPAARRPDPGRRRAAAGLAAPDRGECRSATRTHARPALGGFERDAGGSMGLSVLIIDRAAPLRLTQGNELIARRVFPLLHEHRLTLVAPFAVNEAADFGCGR